MQETPETLRRLRPLVGQQGSRLLPPEIPVLLDIVNLAFKLAALALPLLLKGRQLVLYRCQFYRQPAVFRGVCWREILVGVCWYTLNSSAGSICHSPLPSLLPLKRPVLMAFRMVALVLPVWSAACLAVNMA
jgi:hypothetical protein